MCGSSYRPKPTWNSEEGAICVYIYIYIYKDQHPLTRDMLFLQSVLVCSKVFRKGDSSVDYG